MNKTNLDLLTIAKKVSREVYGFTPTKIRKNKKKYNRKVDKANLKTLTNTNE